ncbi:hypothetical protein [Belliella aquatica]|uniref:Uncharacterized protein n=1 Tax=Belliella aquatica TaxID=1323734 RepID=A0ABQ1MAP6_9BACT|nr:hypothetical protein [Belliella aquatica]MCH7406296.1 hypothetical protein [Belliella aquatica]GGC37708.1 hypothetical protein GCM10010993_15700 [Belliella aquatica]
MARPSVELIKAFRKTIDKLKSGAPYQWGHMGACNCGNLAQEITKISKGDIHQYALQRHGDWNEQLNDYCPTSGLPMDTVIEKLIDAGLTIADLGHLEKLSSPEVLKEIPFERRMDLKKNKKEDVIFYMETWVKILEKKWLEDQKIDLKINDLGNKRKKISTSVLA